MFQEHFHEVEAKERKQLDHLICAALVNRLEFARPEALKFFRTIFTQLEKEVKGVFKQTFINSRFGERHLIIECFQNEFK